MLPTWVESRIGQPGSESLLVKTELTFFNHKEHKEHKEGF